MSFKTSVLIWFSRSCGTASPPAPLFIFAVKEKEQKFSLSSINFYLCCCKEKLTARGIN